MELAVRDPLVGVTVGQRYEVLARISRGGMASVYRALDVRLDREVALKIMHPHLAESADFLARFQTEARAAARLTHPTIVTVADQGVDGTTAWLAMELLPGRTVKDELADRGTFTLAEVSAVMECLLAGLATAHDAGIIHRDIKPENILATGAPLGSALPAYKVSDFGLARALSAGGVTQSVMGTPAYIAPELARDGRVDARVDLYAAGIVLYELLTGRQPFTADSPVQVILAHISTDVPAVTDAVGQVFGPQGREIDALVSWACARDPEQRPARAADLLGELRTVLGGFAPAQLHVRHAAATTGTAEPAAEAADGASARWFDTIAHDGGTPEPVLSGPDQPTVALPPESVAQTRMSVSSPVAPSRPPAPPDHYESFEDEDPADAYPGDAYPGDAYPNDAYPGDAYPQRPPELSGGPPRGGPAGRSGEVPGRSDGRRRRTEQVVGVALLGAMILALMAAGLIWWAQVGPGAYTTTPDVTAMSEADAQRLLSNAGLGATTRDTFDDAVADGAVVSTQPEPGGRVRKGGDVTLVVSRGPAQVPVPAVAGLTLEAATAALSGAGLPAPTASDAFDDAAPVGTVITADPPAGTLVNRDVAVAVTISKGPQPRDVPTVVGQTQDAAQAALAASGLGTGALSEQHDPSVAAGVVLSQTPDSGTLPPGGTVDLVISLGPEFALVPDVRNLTGQQAQDLLQSLGFTVNRSGTRFFDRVLSQSPDPGTQVDPGSAVTIVTF